MRKRRREPEEHRLQNGAADRDDEGGHHGLGMARLEPVQRAEQDGTGHEKPRVLGAMLEGLGEIGHRRKASRDVGGPPLKIWSEKDEAAASSPRSRGALAPRLLSLV